MEQYIMTGADVHDKSILCLTALGREMPVKRSFANTRAGRGALIVYLRARAREAGDAKVVLAYEASSVGFGLYDELSEAGMACCVLAPTKIPRSADHRRGKTDERDALRLLELVRGHVLAGNALPSVWVPDAATRDDRELVRARLDAADKLTALKAQVQSLLKRHGLKRPSGSGGGWTRAFRAWLAALTGPRGPLGSGGRAALASLLRQMAALEAEVAALDTHVRALSGEARYAEPARALTALKGVGLLTAMVFLTELGDLSRFGNRKQVGAFLGLVPSSSESGDAADRKGHITHQGPWRVRRVLCQAVWSRVRTDPEAEAAYARIVAKNPRHRKIAVVAVMRRLAVRMWHLARDVQTETGCLSAARAAA